MSAWRTKQLTISIGKMSTRLFVRASWECDNGLFAAGTNFFILLAIFKTEKLDVLSD